jgi:type VI protein secretion system component VasK
MESETIKTLAQLGGQVVIACVALWLICRLADKYMAGFLAAMQAQATAMMKQAECIEGAKDSIQQFIDHDNNDHREILLGLRVVIKEVQQMGADLKAQREVIQGLCKDAGKPAGAVARIG